MCRQSAKPVQYVKICSLYGAGFYYIPGTDTCIKIGGFVRTEWLYNSNGSFGPYTSDQYTRATNYIRNRSRFVLSMDTRSQTEYGTLRSYGRGGWQWTSGDYQVGGSQGASNVTGAGSQTGAPINSSSTTYFDRAFIQLAGFTFGKTQSYFDFFNAGYFSNQTPWMWMDTGGSGTPVFAYTAQFGNGMSATLSVEDYTEQSLPVVGVLAGGGNVSTTGSSSVGNNRGYWVPDFVANLRVDQGWGSAQIQGALHQDAAQYYAGATNLVFSHPADAWGWAVGGGVTINLPMLGKGDLFSVGTNYCEGASRYCSNPAGGVLGSGALYGERSGGTFGQGTLVDAYYNNVLGTRSGLQLPKVWNVEAGIAHHWNAQWQTSLYGGYINYKANSNAVNTLGCAGNFGGSLGGTAQTSGCLDWSAWQVGSRTLWNPVANLDVSLDVLYHKVNGALNGATRAAPTGSGQAFLTYGDVGEFTGMFRVQRNFWP
ncbi:MAG: porin [Pseudolabrys sp.]